MTTNRVGFALYSKDMCLQRVLVFDTCHLAKELKLLLVKFEECR